MQVTAELRNWYKSPGWNVYIGDVFGDTKERWVDGKTIHTSDVRQVDDYGGYLIVTTLNSVYRLERCFERMVHTSTTL